MAQAVLGYSRKGLYGSDPHEALCAESRGELHDAENCPLLSRHSDTETRSTLWKHKNGNYVSIDYRMIPVGYGEASRVISFVDNSTRLHNQAEMEKFSEYVEKSPAPLAEFVLDGQLLFGNTSMQELILEYGFDENGNARVIPKDIHKIGEVLQANKYQDETAEVTLGDRVFMWHFHLLESEEESTMVGYAFDISAQKEAERIADEQRSAARKEFYAKMVHELRSPLNAIVGFSDLLLGDLQEKIDEDQTRWLSMIKNAGMQLNEQVSATLDITKIESGKMSLDISEFAVAELCEDVFNQLKPLGKGKKFQLKFTADTDQRIFSDSTKVRQIVVNLLTNAIKYTKDGSVHLIASEKAHESLGKCIRILVVDTGIGIKEEDLPRLFLSFEQVEDDHTRKIQGTGLGLALVSNLTKLLGGQINAESVYGEGSKFEVLIPFLSSNQQ